MRAVRGRRSASELGPKEGARPLETPPSASELYKDDFPAQCLPDVRMAHTQVESAVPTGAWRSTLHSANAFAVDSTLDSAGAVQIGTVLFVEPDAGLTIHSGLKQRLLDAGVQRIRDIVGTLQSPSAVQAVSS